MPSILTIPQIIEIGYASVYLSANYTAKGSLFGGTVIKPTPPVQIQMVTDGLNWGYSGGAETDASLRTVGNYLYWLCGMFQLQAQNIISGPGGGSVSPTPSGGATPNPYDWEVTPTSEPLADGESTVTLTNFIGFNIIFARGGIVQSTVDLGGSFYQWNRVTGEFICSPAAFSGELMTITPV